MSEPGGLPEPGERLEPDELGRRLDRLQAHLGTVTVGPADQIRERGSRRRRNAAASALAATFGVVAVLGLGTVRALEAQSRPVPADRAPTVAPPVNPRPDGQADTRLDPDPVLAPGTRLVLPDALLTPELFPASPGVHWQAGPIRSGPQFWASTRSDDHPHCWALRLPGAVQEAARHFRLPADTSRPEADQVLALAPSPAQAAAALQAARRRCAAGATNPVFNPPPGSPPVTQFKDLNGLNGFVYTRDATSAGAVANRPNCEYAVLVQRGPLLVLLVLRQQAFSYDLPRADAIAVTLQAADRALASTTAAATAETGPVG